MRCEFCGEEVEGVPFQKDGMNFCSLECSDAMETGESMPLRGDMLDDPDDYDEEDIDDTDDDDDDEDEEDEDEDEDGESLFDDDFMDDDILANDERY